MNKSPVLYRLFFGAVILAAVLLLALPKSLQGDGDFQSCTLTAGEALEVPELWIGDEERRALVELAYRPEVLSALEGDGLVELPVRTARALVTAGLPKGARVTGFSANGGVVLVDYRLGSSRVQLEYLPEGAVRKTVSGVSPGGTGAADIYVNEDNQTFQHYWQ